MRMTGTILTISSKNYSSWSLRGWLLCRMAGLDFVEEVVPPDDPANRAELLLAPRAITKVTRWSTDTSSSGLASLVRAGEDLLDLHADDHRLLDLRRGQQAVALCHV
jgi:hypothetical protein